MVRSSAPLSSAFYPNKRLFDQSVERWFAKITQQRIRRGTFTAVKHLEAAILMTSRPITAIQSLLPGRLLPT